MRDKKDTGKGYVPADVLVLLVEDYVPGDVLILLVEDYVLGDVLVLLVEDYVLGDVLVLLVEDYVPGDILILLVENGFKITTQADGSIYETEKWSKDFTEVTMISLKKKPKATKFSQDRNSSSDDA
jgi:hypothetical protein